MLWHLIIFSCQVLYKMHNWSNESISWSNFIWQHRSCMGCHLFGKNLPQMLQLASAFPSQVISLEGWTDVMYFVQDAHSFWNWIYFVCLIVVSIYVPRKKDGFKLKLYFRLGHSSWSTFALSSLQPSSLRLKREKQQRWRLREQSLPLPPLFLLSLTGMWTVQINWE